MSITVFQLEKVQLLCSICTEEVTCWGIRMPDTRFFFVWFHFCLVRCIPSERICPSEVNPTERKLKSHYIENGFRCDGPTPLRHAAFRVLQWQLAAVFTIHWRLRKSFAKKRRRKNFLKVVWAFGARRFAR